ncbi:MAG TPA: DUF6088 family protein [Ignavibacteriaceae bacterium]|nr:DUF6088 family protein [Ignavibacteriaceae bacterium]
MKITEYITLTIDRLPKGYIFTYKDFIDAVNNKEAIIKALNRMANSGKIAKVSKGKYYKPESTVFGKLEPNQYQIVKDLLEKNGKIVGYLTGYSIYNQLGLSTQVSNTIQIGKNEIRSSFKRKRFTISFIKQKNIITKENILLLQILDSIRLIKKIPDTTIESACKRFVAIIKDLSKKDKTTMIRLAQKYPPSTRALLGALLDLSGGAILAAPLLNSLNPITNYKIPGASKVLQTAAKWNII